MSSKSDLEQINYKQIRLLNNDIAEDFIGSSNGRLKVEAEDEAEGNFKEGLKNRKKGNAKKRKPEKNEEDIFKKINRGIDKTLTDSDNSTLKEGFHVIIVILLTTTMFQNTIHKSTGAIDSTSFDKMFIVPIFNKIKEQIKMLMTLISTTRELSSFGKNVFIGGDSGDIFDIANWSANTKISAALISYFPMLWLSQFFLLKFSEIVKWISGVKWKEIFNMLISGKRFNERLFPDMGLYNKPKNPLLITIFSLYFVYLAGKVFFDYLEFWIKIPIFFVLFLCVWFGAVLFPFLNVSAFIFFITMAAYTLIMPLRFYYDGAKFFPHSFMDTLNQQNDLANWMKKFIDATYKVFIFISAIIFFYKISQLGSTTLKTFYAALSGVVFLLWSAFVWKEYFPESSAKLSPEPVNMSAGLEKYNT